MAGPGMLSFARVPLVDLVPADGLASDRYKQATTLLYQSLQKFSFAVVQLSATDDILLRCVLDSARMYFHQRALPGPESIRTEDSQDWNRSAGYYSEPQYAKEIYDYRPGRTPDSTELPPAGLPELFVTLGTAARYVLEAIAWVLDLRSFSFTDLLDNMPLKTGEVSTSLLSVSCHGRPGFHHGSMDLPIFDGHEQHADKGLVTLMKSDKHGLQIRDMHGRWQLADGELGPQDVVLYCGLSLYQATGGHVSPAFFKTEIGGPGHMHIYGRCSVAFRLMPKATAVLHCSAMTAAGVPVPSPFQQPVTVHDFMQRSHPLDQLIGGRHVANFPFATPPEGPIKSLKRRKQVSRGKPLAPSKRLRLEAQRVLKERVQEIAESKNLKIRFCNFKDCEENHLTTLDSPCAALRAELGWPHGVPFVHPHDLPNKAKQAFLEAYEPGWTASQDVELGLIEAGHSHSHHSSAEWSSKMAHLYFFVIYVTPMQASEGIDFYSAGAINILWGK